MTDRGDEEATSKEKPPALEYKVPKLERWHALVRRAGQSDQCALPERQVLDRCPEVWERCGDLVTQMQQGWLDLLG
jgi:hypothetical protein